MSNRIGAGGPFLVPSQVDISETQPTARLRTNGPAEYDLLMMAGISVLLSTTPASDPQWQSNQPELQARTHELALIQSQQFSGLLRAQTPAVAAAANQGRRLTIDPSLVDIAPSSLLRSTAPSQVATNRPRMLVSETPSVEAQDSFSWSQYLIEFDAPLLKPRVTDPQRPEEFPSQLLRALPTTAPVGINPRVLNAPAADVQAYPSFRIQAQVPLAATPDFRPRILVNAPDIQPDLQSKSFTPRFEPALVNTRFLTAGPDQPQEFPSKLSAPRFEASAAIAGIQPHVLVVQAQDNIDGLFTSSSKLVIPNHVEPFVPPPPAPEPTGGATIGDPYARAIIEQQIRELNEREQHEADRRQRDQAERVRSEKTADSQSLVAVPTLQVELTPAPLPPALADINVPQIDIGSRVQAIEQAADQFAAALQQQAAQQAARQAQLDAIAQHALIIGIQIDLAALQDEDDLDAILALLLLL